MGLVRPHGAGAPRMGKTRNGDVCRIFYYAMCLSMIPTYAFADDEG